MLGQRSEQLKALICHNLAVLNYAELSTYMERCEAGEVSASKEQDNQALLEGINKVDAEEDFQKKENDLIKEQLYL